MADKDRGKKHIGAGRDNPSTNRFFTPGKGQPHTGDGKTSKGVFGGIIKVVFRSGKDKD